MNPPPLLSIVTITKADPDGLRTTMDALTRWTALDWVEHFVISPDELPQFSGSTLVRDQGQGRSQAFNLGVGRSRGTWIWFVNGGDAPDGNLQPDWLRTLLEATDADIIAGSIRYLPSGKVKGPPPIDRLFPLRHCWPQHPGTLVRKRALPLEETFSPTYHAAMDFDLWLRLFRQGRRVDCLGVVFAEFAEGGISNSPRGLRTVFREDLKLLLGGAPRAIMHHIAGIVGVFRTLLRAAKRSWRS
jgi:hypothetical protein